MTAMRTADHDTTVKIRIPFLPARRSHLKPPDAATAVAGMRGRSLTIKQHAPLPGAFFLAYLIREEKP